MPRVLIVEEALRDLKAHWFEYIQTIVGAANKLGWQADIACNLNADKELVSKLSAFPIFKYSRYLDTKETKWPGEKYYAFVLHSMRIIKVLWSFLIIQKKYDHIFAPTILVHHLLAWYFIMRLHPNKPSKLTLFFVTNPGIWNSETKQAYLPKSAFVLKTLLKMFSGLSKKGKVVFAVETLGAKNEFENLSGLPVKLLPHPVPFTDSTSENQVKNIKSPVFSCLGFARHEKGSDLLKIAIEQILNEYPDFKGHFIVQWTDAFTMPDGSLCQPGTVLLNNPQITIIDYAMKSDEYKKLLSKTDCMVLPYRNSSYYARLSRIAIECACLGIPVLYTKDGWLEENVTEYGIGLGIEDEDIDSLKKGILTMYNGYINHLMNTNTNRSKAVNYYSPDNFCKLLLQ